MLQEFTNLAPIVDFSVVDLDNVGQGQLVACCNTGASGSLRLVRAGISIVEHAGIELEGVTLSDVACHGISQPFLASCVLVLLESELCDHQNRCAYPCSCVPATATPQPGVERLVAVCASLLHGARLVHRHGQADATVEQPCCEGRAELDSSMSCFGGVAVAPCMRGHRRASVATVPPSASASLTWTAVLRGGACSRLSQPPVRAFVAV